MPAGSYHTFQLAHMTSASWLLPQAQISSYQTCQLAATTLSNWLKWQGPAGSCHMLKLAHITHACWLLPTLKLAPIPHVSWQLPRAPAGSYGTCQLSLTKHSRWLLSHAQAGSYHALKLAATTRTSWHSSHTQAAVQYTFQLPFHNLKLACTTLSSWLLPLGQAVSYSTTFSSWLLQHAQDGYCHTQKLALNTLSSWLIPHIKAGSFLVYIFHTYYLLHICTVQVFNTFYFFTESIFLALIKKATEVTKLRSTIHSGKNPTIRVQIKAHFKPRRVPLLKGTYHTTFYSFFLNRITFSSHNRHAENLYWIVSNIGGIIHTRNNSLMYFHKHQGVN